MRGNSHKKSPIRKRELIIANRILLYIFGNNRIYCSKFCDGAQMQHKAQTEHISYVIRPTETKLSGLML